MNVLVVMEGGGFGGGRGLAIEDDDGVFCLS